jgi:hypothetical protein
MTVSSVTEGSFIVTANVSSEDLDANTVDNSMATTLSATAPVPEPVPVPTPAPVSQQDQGGGGCTTARAGTPFDPSLPLLAGLGVFGLALRRVGARRSPCQP